MIPHLVYYQLVILVLLWLCLMVPHLWPSPTRGAPKTPTRPIRPKRTRSTESKPFAGLTQKPHCALCGLDHMKVNAFGKQFFPTPVSDLSDFKRLGARPSYKSLGKSGTLSLDFPLLNCLGKVGRNFFPYMSCVM